MKPHRWLVAALFSLAVLVPYLTQVNDLPASAGNKGDDGFVPMFNGKDLTGWVNVNGAPGTFYVKDDQIITTGKPTGFLRTAKQYENFIAEFDWMHVPPAPGAVGNSGFFVWADPIPALGTGYTRGIEVQVLVNLEWKDKTSGAVTASSHGDLFSIWGAKCIPDRPHPLGWDRCMPSENRAKGANEWNHYRVEANDGVLKLAVNGKVVSGVSKCNPRKGYLALESEGSECRFKNLKIKELPSTNPKPDEVANVAQGHEALYTGLDLSGWTADEDARKHWQPKDTVLHYDGKGKELRTEKQYADAEFITDFRLSSKSTETVQFSFRGAAKPALFVRFNQKNMASVVGGSNEDGTSPWTAGGVAGSAPLQPVGKWNRLQATIKNQKGNGGPELTVTLNGKQIYSHAGVNPAPPQGSFGVQPYGGIDLANLFVRELGKKEK